jgi:GT2 family glycosyltransferase
MSTPALTIVTGTVDRPDSIGRLIKSVVERTKCDYELLIADASEKPIQYSHPNVRVIHEWPRQGCVKGYNRAFREATGKWVIWLNDDAEVLENYDQASIEFMETNPRIGLGALYYKDPCVVDAAGNLPFHVNLHVNILYANFGILSRELGNHIGWFPEEIKMYGCDNALAFEVLLAGYGIADIPGARVIHHAVQDSTRAENQKERMKDNLAFYQKYKSKMGQIRQAYEANATKNKFIKLTTNAVTRAGLPE